MSIRIEEAYNDCFERMLSGEPLESCLSSYPEYASELHAMLHTAYDIKRKAYPIQPRPEFKYWARVRLQNTMYYPDPTRAEIKPRSISFSLRRNLAVSMAALLVFIIASTGAVAASSDAMPDEPLYGVKLAVEQAQVMLAPSDLDKTEIYARMAEKRAQEIAVMAVKGNNEKVVATAQIMNRQLQQLEANLAKMEQEEAAEIARNMAAISSGPVTAPSATVAAPSATSTTPPATTTTPSTVTPVEPVIPVPPQLPPVPPATTNATMPVPSSLPPMPPKMADSKVNIQPAVTANVTRPATFQQDTSKGATAAQSEQAAKRAAAIAKARATANTSTAKSLTILQNALDKAPESVKPSLNNVINRTITTNKNLQFDPVRNPPIKEPQNTSPNIKNSNDDKNDDKDDIDKPAIKPNVIPNIKPNLNNKNEVTRPNIKPNTDNKR